MSKLIVSLRLRLLAAAFCAAMLGHATSAGAQMIVGDRMGNFASAFDVKVDQRIYPFNAYVIETSVPANILWPGEQPTWTIQLQNNTDAPITTAGKIDVIRYGTHGQPGDVWLSTVFKIADAASVPISVNIPAHGFQNVTISPKLPNELGGYGVVADLGGAGRRFVVSAIRTFKPITEKIQFPSLSLDDQPGDTLPRLGVQAIRFGLGWTPPESKNYDRNMATLDEKLQDDKKKNITVMLMVMGGETKQPLGRPRPHLDDQNVLLQTKSDEAWLPEQDDEFQAWVEKVTSKYGWPNGPVTAIELWNEPWEGISISGWGADMLRFREMYRHMAAGVLQARKDAGVQVLLAGCDSSSNTIDKLFPDDTDEFLPLLDAVTIHYQGIASPSIYKKWINRQGPYGRVRIWDTESWVANTDDRVAAVVATNKSAGYDRAMGVYGGNIAEHKDFKMMLDDGKARRMVQDGAWSTAASVGAAVHFIGERHFNRLLFQNGLPWVMVFDGLPGADGAASSDDGTIVVVGDIGEEFGKDLLLHRTIMGLKQLDDLKAARAQLAALASDAPADVRADLTKKVTALSTISGGTMTLDDGGGKFKAFDFYGNPLAGNGGKINVPLDGRGFFLRSDGSARSFAQLVDAVSKSHVDGFECLEMIPHDMLSTVETKPTVRITCTNVFNRPITGTLTATLGNLQVESPGSLSFGPNETRDVELKITGGDSVPENTYPLTLKFDGGADGHSEYEEDVHVNVIAHRTITVDGKLDDWKGVLPQPVVSAGSSAPTMEAAAWFPFKGFDPSIKKGFATGYMAYDANNFYFAAKIVDPNPDPGTLRFEKRDDDVYFYPDKSYAIDPNTTFATHMGAITLDIRKPFALQDPQNPALRTFSTLDSVSTSFKVKLSMPVDQTRQVALYFLDNDDHELGRKVNTVTVTDSKTGKTLARNVFKEFGHGAYAIYNISGDVDITIHGGMGFMAASLSGLFIDPSSQPISVSRTSAKFVRTDEETGGNWMQSYGKLGYYIAGGAEKLPDDVQISIPQVIHKTELTWPEGVRHYSYAHDPILPAGDSPSFDNVQIAFNAIPVDQDPVCIPSPPGTPPEYVSYRDTDYQYALNKVADKYGGGTEIWRLDVPDHMRVHFFPRQPKASWEGAVKNGQLVTTQDGSTRIVECALPWSEIPDVKTLLDAGKTVKFSFRVNSNASKGCMELARNRAVSRKNPFAFSVDWVEHWANEVEFAFEK